MMSRRAHQATYHAKQATRTAWTANGINANRKENRMVTNSKENRMDTKRLAASWCVRVAVLAIGCTALATDAVGQDKRIIHDAEHYLLEAQHGEKWAAEDRVTRASGHLSYKKSRANRADGEQNKCEP